MITRYNKQEIQYLNQTVLEEVKNMKCTLNHMKQDKIESLQNQNRSLSSQVENLLRTSQQLTSSLKSANMQTQTLQTQIQVQKMRQSILKPSITSLKLEKQKSDEENANLTNLCDQAEKRNKELSLQLYELTKKKEEMDGILERLKKQLKIYQHIGSNNCNLVKTSDNMRKTHECLLRTLNVMKNKLESHKKYLSILQKKAVKEQTANENSTNNKIHPPNSKSSSCLKNNLKNERVNCQIEKNAKKTEDERKKLKQFDELTRKRNKMLMKSGKI